MPLLAARSTQLNQLNLVAVRIFNEGDHRAAVLHRSSFADDFNAFGLEVGAHLVNVVHAQCEMTKRITLIVTGCSPVMSQFDDGIIFFVAITNKRKGKLTAWDNPVYVRASSLTGHNKTSVTRQDC